MNYKTFFNIFCEIFHYSFIVSFLLLLILPRRSRSFSRRSQGCTSCPLCLCGKKMLVGQILYNGDHGVFHGDHKAELLVLCAFVVKRCLWDKYFTTKIMEFSRRSQGCTSCPLCLCGNKMLVGQLFYHGDHGVFHGDHKDNLSALCAFA